MKPLHIFLLLLMSLHTRANDGAFYAAGNQLIPIQETSIAVRKEILTLKKVNQDYIDVTVYYEFFNPGPDKIITVGFEAGSPMGDVDGRPKKGQHPYIYDFTTQLNGMFLKYAVAYVDDSLYAKNGEVKSKDLAALVKKSENSDYMDFSYVYHFKAKFVSGKNIIQHTYRYHCSNSVYEVYSIPYILTAARRWGNRQIDDFTLVLDMGDFETFNLKETFFKGMSNWSIHGIGKMYVTKILEDDADTVLRCHVRKGYVQFHQANFRPEGELSLYAEEPYFMGYNPAYIPFSQAQLRDPDDTSDESRRRIYRNLPFARRGYVFLSADLKSFYEKQDWYMPDPNYQPDVEMLDEKEKKWMERWK